MTIQQALRWGKEYLLQAGMEDVQRDVQLLLEHVLNVSRMILYAYPERSLTTAQEQQFRHLIERRSKGEPVAYLMGTREFYGRDFLVDRRVLIPRPETELLVEATLQSIRRRLQAGSMPLVADIGTGSGVIPVTLALEAPDLQYLYAIDISSDALEVAKLNCLKHGVAEKIRLLQGDLLAPLPETVDIITANLPYVGTDEMDVLTVDVRDYEPHLALFSGVQGMDLLSRFLQEASRPGKLKAGAELFLEIGYRQGEAVTEAARSLWPQAEVTCQKDYAGLDRLVHVRLSHTS